MSNIKEFTAFRKIQRKASLAQRSPEWHLSRETCIGGSELGAWLGVNPFLKRDRLLKEKILPRRFFSNQAMEHGMLCEGISARYAEKYFRCIVHETGSIDGCVPYHRYSPDGLALIPKGFSFPEQKHAVYAIGDHTAETSNTIQPVGSAEYDLVLFEFKNPFKNEELHHEIPQHYIPQPLSGLCDIPLTNYAIFINCKVIIPDYEPSLCAVCGNVDYCGTDSARLIPTPKGKHVITCYGDTCVNDSVAVGYIGLYSLAPMRLPFGYRQILESKDIHKKYKVKIGGRLMQEAAFDQWCERNLVVKLKFIPVKILDARITKLQRDPHFMARLAAQLKADMEMVAREKAALLNL